MFGKRKHRDGGQQRKEPKAAPAAVSDESQNSGAPAATPAPPKPASKPDASAILNRQATPPVRPDQARRPAQRGTGQGENGEGKKLIVGREIELSGEIRSCDKLVVEGTVDADLSDSVALEVTPSGVYKGSAVIDVAEIAGRFEGDLTVRERLYLRATGQVHGTIRYRGLEIESGGRIGGTLIELSDDEAARLRDAKAAPAKPATESPAPAAQTRAETAERQREPDGADTADTFAWNNRSSLHG